MCPNVAEVAGWIRSIPTTSNPVSNRRAAALRASKWAGAMMVRNPGSKWGYLWWAIEGMIEML
jgi:hypothetical protein